MMENVLTHRRDATAPLAASNSPGSRVRYPAMEKSMGSPCHTTAAKPSKADTLVDGGVDKHKSTLGNHENDRQLYKYGYE